MKKWWVISGIIIVAAAFTTVTNKTRINDPEDIKKAVNKSLPLLQTTSHIFLENAGGCQSCHHQDLTAVSLSLAKENGFAVNDTSLTEIFDSIMHVTKSWRTALVQNEDPVAIVMSAGYQLWALWANQYKSNKLIEMLVKNLMQRQTGDGSWVSPNPRPPLEYYSFSATALTAAGIQYYAPPSLRQEISKKLEKARAWMIRTVPETNEERVFQLLGLKWINGDKDFIKQQAKKLVATQREDGGWSQLATLESDSYATGQALYALIETEQLKPADPAFQKGVSFLLKTQHDDGSWKVKSRSFPFVPFVETNFPHKKDQFISAAGTNWAIMALILSAK
ncbi:MAG TPA: prenyltransferase/squalene oxidase repeat-containing protein [Chitinophagaceae bacterium]|nr:prenyltransferase/squalene oxidase repeat-containing protein [Chitinophagaceae bacterium]